MSSGPLPGISSSTHRNPTLSTLRNHTRFDRVWCSGNIVDSQLFQQLTALSTAPGSTPGIRVLMFFLDFLSSIQHELVDKCLHNIKIHQRLESAGIWRPNFYLLFWLQSWRRNIPQTLHILDATLPLFKSIGWPTRGILSLSVFFPS
jgi:hypothetical protein